MAEGFYSLEAQVISRGEGRSALAAAAYRSGELLAREHGDGNVEVQDYSRRNGIEQTGIELPQQAPAWAQERNILWTRVEEAEKRKDAQLAREFRVAFDHRFSSEQRREVLETYIHQEFTNNGFAADWAIHAPSQAGDSRNWHAHVMVPLRGFDGDGFARTKPQEYADWNNRTERLKHWRAAWDETLNQAALRYEIRDEAGERLNFDHRSYAGRGDETEPTQHLGPKATALERQGVETRIGNLNRAIENRNAERERRQAFNPAEQKLTQNEEPVSALKPEGEQQNQHMHTDPNYGKPQIWEVWDAAERRDARREAMEQDHHERDPFVKMEVRAERRKPHHLGFEQKNDKRARDQELMI